jgi:hypothetical protein
MVVVTHTEICIPITYNKEFYRGRLVFYFKIRKFLKFIHTYTAPKYCRNTSNFENIVCFMMRKDIYTNVNALT